MYKLIGGQKFDRATPALLACNWLPIAELLEIRFACFAFKAVRGELTDSLQNLFQTKTIGHRYGTRTNANSEQFVVPTTKRKVGEKSLAYRGPKLLNNLFTEMGINILSLPSTKAFKEQLKRGRWQRFENLAEEIANL